MPGVPAVALVEVHDHRREALERASARERAGVERAAGRRGSRRARARAPSRPRRRRRRTRPRPAAPRRRGVEAASEWSPASDRAVELGLDSLGERRRVARGQDARRREAQLGGDGEHRRRADRVAQLACGVERGLGLRREDDEVGVCARRRRSSRRLRRAPRAAAARALASREPMTTSCPAPTSRVGERAPNGPVPPTIATRTRPPATTSASRRSDVAVAHERRRDDELDGRLGAARPPRRSRARRSSPRNTVHVGGCRPARHAREHTVERAGDRLAADERADRDAAHAARLRSPRGSRAPRGSARSRGTGCSARGGSPPRRRAHRGRPARARASSAPS